MKILLIEDDPDDVAVFRAMILRRPKGAGVVETVHADTLAEGLALLARGGIDLVVLDLGLPDSQGLATLDAVNANSSAVPVVVLSGEDDESVIDEAIRHGTQEFLVKGAFDARRLWQTVRHALLRSRWADSASALAEVNRALAAALDGMGQLTHALQELNQAMTRRRLP